MGGSGAGLKAITGGDAVSVDNTRTRTQHIPAVILAVNNNPMRFTDRSGGVSSPGDYHFRADSPGGARPAARG
ncbi:hypothetical protein RAG37_11495 [Klebsiella pneumoniae]